MYVENIENIVLGMAEIIHENRALRERVEDLELKLGIEKARLFGKYDLADKLDKRESENISFNVAKSCGWLTNDEKGYIPDMVELTEDDLKFLNKHVM